MRMLVRNRRFAAVLTLGALTACGGGGDEPGLCLGIGSCRPLMLQGTAAIGQAVAGAKVMARCQKGQGTATTDEQGNFKLALSGAELPCALELSGANDGLKLRSLAIPGANGELVNLTLLTEMVTTRLARKDAGQYFSAFDANAGKALSPEKVKQAQAEVAKLLEPTTTIKGLTDYLGTPLKAATPSNPSPGDAQDKLLDVLHKRLSKDRQSKLLAVLASANTPEDPGPFVPWLTVEPATLALLPGATRHLMADINYPPKVQHVRQPVSWSLVDPNSGSIEALTGKYTAPTVPGTYRVRATREDFRDVSATVTITVGSLLTLDQRWNSGIRTPKTAVVRDANALLALWKQHVVLPTGAMAEPPPAVDFKQEMVLAVFAGGKPTGCDGVNIDSAVLSGGKLQVSYRETTGAPGQACTMVMTSPSHWVKLARSDAPVEFLRKP